MKKLSTGFYMNETKNMGINALFTAIMFLLLPGVANFSYGQTAVFSENFESNWTTPPTLSPAWSGTITPANNVWHRNDYTTGWSSGSGAYTPTGANSTTYSARFHSYYATSGSTGDIITPAINLSAYTQGSNFLEFYYINTSGSDVLNVYLSTNGGTSYGSSLATLTTATAWTLYSVDLGTTSNNVMIKFTATSDFGYTDIGIDEVKIINYPNIFSGTGTYIVPAGVYSLTVECWGGGGRGGSTISSATECGGGGGGAYSKKVVSVTPGSTTYITVGSGSTSTSAGGDSHYSLTNDTAASVVRAKGGKSVPNNTATGATGGSATYGKGDIKYSGGNGASGSSGNYGGGGGSSAGTGANGNNGSGSAGGTAPAGGGKGGNGATSNGNGNPGSSPGGGGGGVRSGNNGNQTGGAGAKGRVIITPNYPTLAVTPASLDFGYVASGSTSANQTYTLSGSYLSPASGSITVTAPAGFEVSLSSGSGFGSSVNVSYSGSALASTTIYSRFKPTGSPQDYSGNITNAGGGATSVDVAVTGTSWTDCSGTPAPGNTLANPNPVCIGNAVNLSLQNSVEAKGITYQWQSSPNNSTWTNITPVFLNTDFSSLPTNTNVYGDATVTGGYLRLTRAVNSLTGGWVIQNTPGSNITPFNVTFDYRIYDGGTNGADGMSLSYASDIANNAGPGEEGEGNGIIVKFDTYDNSAGTTNSQIRINYGGSQIWSNTVGAFNLRSSSYRSVKLTVDNNGYLSLSIATTSIVSNLLLPGYKAADKSNWKFKFSARTGGLNDMHSIDNLSIQYGDNPTLTVSPTTNTYYRCQATCAVSASTGTSTSALVTVDPLSVAGTASSNQTICSGSSPSNITLSESTGSIQWQSSLDNSNWSNISGATSSPLTSAQMGSLTQTTYYHAIVTSGVCSSATSNAVTVTVDPTSVGGTLSGSASVCSGTNSSKLVLNGYTGSIIKWQYSTIPDGTWTDISNTTSSYFADNLTSTLQYRVQIKSGVCPETYSAATGIYVDPSYTWEGTSSNDWSAVSNWKYTDANYFDNPATPPISCSDVIVPGSAVTYFPTISSPANCKTLTLESGASLLGESNLTYTSATVKREIANDWKWHFLSSPVSNQDIWPQFAPTPDYTTGWTQTSVTQPYWNWDFYYFNPNCPTTGLYWVNLRKLNGDYNNGTEWALNSEAGFGGTTPPEFEKGRGYLVAYDVDWYPTQNPTNHVFSGSLYTGLVTKAIINNQSEFNLVGNPYPSSLDWKSTSWGTGRDNLKYDENAGGYDYWIWNDSDGNYGVFNSGGTTGTHGTSQYIAPTQAFFVKASSSGNFDMNNNVRAHSTQSWLKQSELANSALLLRLTTDVNSFNDEIIVEFDQLFTGGGSDKLWSWYTEAPEFYTVKAGNNYSIERNTEANEDAVVNISAKCGVDANYTITATNIADFALCNKVYLEDLKTGNKINLKENNSYSFAGGPNDDRARFKLTFAETIGTDEPETIKPLYIYSVGKDVFINANQLTVGKSDIFIYDALGRLVYRGVYTPAAGNVKHTSLITPGAYVVKAITRTGTITAKIIIP